MYASKVVSQGVSGAVQAVLGIQLTDGGGHLEHDVEGATDVGRSDFRQVEGHGLVGKTHSPSPA